MAKKLKTVESVAIDDCEIYEIVSVTPDESLALVDCELDESVQVKTLIAVDDGIPITSSRKTARRDHDFPIHELEIGQSFFIPKSESIPHPAKSMAALAVSATRYYSAPADNGETRINRLGNVVPVVVKSRIFAVRSRVEDGVIGARVWRV